MALETTGDASGLVTFVGSDEEIIQNESVGATPNNVIQFNQTALNEVATTTYSSVLTVTNNGSEAVGLSVDDSQGTDPNNLVGSALDVQDSSGNSIVDSTGNKAINLSADGGSKTLSIIIDLQNNSTADLSTIGSIVFAARTSDSA
ncbi:hypothetical protein [Halorubrum sp. ARQ200]|uniref:hypothetical protein n=1 Tax=Halorubrum sp. ARQ200 TaxID=1855872 RepID=UPI0018EEB0D3|nr:hypothetical protein [Halorubrum sp. ARQ200]